MANNPQQAREFAEAQKVANDAMERGNDIAWALGEALNKQLESAKELNSSFIEYMTSTYACKASVKAGDRLSLQEQKFLVDKLFATEHPYFCPHGRPIIINLSIDELDKRFERK